MIVLIKIKGRKLEVTMNDKTTEHNKAFIDKLSFKDAMYYLESENKKIK